MFGWNNRKLEKIKFYTKYYLGNEIKEIGGARSMHARYKKCMQNFSRKTKTEDTILDSHTLSPLLNRLSYKIWLQFSTMGYMILNCRKLVTNRCPYL
jgi:hypothetical protein